MADAPIKLIYIVGSGRSGSTLLARMLGELQEVVSIGEFKHIWQRNFNENQLCSCGLAFSHCPFWQAVIAQASQTLGPINGQDILRLQSSLDRIRYMPNILYPSAEFQDKLAQMGIILAAFFQAVQHVSGKSIIVDSSKEVSRLFLYDALPQIDLYAVHLVRDSRGVAFSWQRKRVRPEITDKVAYMDLYSPFKAGRRWLLWNVLTEMFARKAKDRYFLLRYEDLIAYPKESLQHIAEKFLLEKTDFPFIQDHELVFTIDEHTVAGNPNRFQKGAMSLQLDTEWQQALKRTDHLAVTGLTWPLLWKYGYFKAHSTQ